MTWVVTGGCGFVGTNLVDVLLTKSQEVVVLDNLSRVGAADNLRWLRSRHSDAWTFVEGDVRDASVLVRLVEEASPSVVVHLAGQVAMTKSIERPRVDFEINALGTLNVLEAVRRHSPETIVLYPSTNKVYGSLDHLRYEETETRYTLPDFPNGLDENLPLDGHSPYGCSKLTADQYVRDYHRIYGIRTVVFRHSSMYGGRQFATRDQGWVGWFCSKALEMADAEAPPFTISGDGKQVRDVLNVEDVIDLYLLAVEHIHEAKGQVYNIGGGTGNSLSLLELFAELERLTGVKMRFKRLPWRTADQRVFIADHQRATHDLGWEPKVDKREGLAQMLHWSGRLAER